MAKKWSSEKQKSKSVKNWSAELDKITKYRETDTSMVNQEYINAFLKNADTYFNSANSDLNNMTWGNANSLYESKNQGFQNLNNQADIINAWLYKNKDALGNDLYETYNKTLGSIYDSGKNVVDIFKSNVDHFKQWASQSEYDAWKEEADYLASIPNLDDYHEYKTAGVVTAALSGVGKFKLTSDHLKEDEEDVYYYLVGKGDTELANKYLETAKYRLAEKLAKEMNNTHLGELAISVGSGLSSFGSGIANFVGGLIGDDESVAPTISQYAYGMVSTDNKGADKVFTDLAQTIANQIPNMAINVALPGLGTVTMGMSAAGNAYAEMRKVEGVQEWQAMAYGTSIGVLEGVLQRAIGGITGLGSNGGFATKAIQKALPTITRNLGKFALSTGASMLDEGFEEALQEILDPIVEGIMTGQISDDQNTIEKVLNNALYSGLLGALSAGTLETVPSAIGKGVGEITLNTKLNSLRNDPDSLKSLLTSIAMENPDTDVSDLINRYNEGQKISNKKLRDTLFSNERSIWNKDYNSLVDATESRLNELGEQGDARKLAESIVKAQYGYDFNEALELSKSQIANNKELGLKDLSYLMAEYSQNSQNKQSLSKAEQKAIRDSEYGSRVSNELNPNMREETSSAWAQGVKTNRLGNTAENVAKTRAALTQLNEESKSQKKLSSDVISYKSGAVDASLTPKGRDAKIEGENKTVSETYARAEGYKGLANETFSKYYKGENIEEYALGFREAYDYGLNGTVKDVKDLANHGSFKSYINEEAREMAFNAGVVDAKYMGIKSKTIKVDGDYKVTVPMSNKALSESKQATIELMKVLAPIAKVNMSTMVSLKDHGLYDPKTNTIYIDLSMDGRDVMIFTLAHELTHHLKRVNPEQFDEFARALFEEVGKTENVEERIAKWMRENKKYYPNMSQAEFKALAREEVVAEMCESFLTDEKVVQRISQKVYETDKGLWNTIKKWFEDLVAKLKKLFADLDPQSENGRIVRDMSDRLDSVRQMWADMVVGAGVVEKSEIDSMVKSSKKDFEDYDKPITTEDVDILRTIPKHTSVNKFTAEEIKNTQKWAYKFYQDLKTKSPFFRAWFGEWRAHEVDNYVNVIQTINREGKNPRGVFINNDTGWAISSSSVGYDETTSHSGKNKKSILAMRNIDAIIQNAILFDTEVSDNGKGKKSFYTAFMHKFYAPINIDGQMYIAKMAVEESYVPKQDETHKKFYHVRAIEIETASSVEIGKSHTSIMENTVSKYSISDFYELVKTFDKEFTPAPQVSKYMLNEDGTPKKFYHGTDAKFTEFKAEEMSHKEGSYFFAENREDAEAYGKNIHEVYLTGRKLADYDNQPSEFYKLRDKRKQVEWLKERGYDGWYADMDSGGWGELSVFSPEQIKSAKGNIGTFSKYETDTKYSRKTVDPITSREELAKALSKVANGEDRAIVESYKANVNLIKGETERLESLRKEIDAIKYKKSITHEGRELSVKEFEQIAYTRAEEQGIDAERVKFKALKESGKYIATVDGKKILEAEKRFRTKDDIDKLATLEHNYQATIKRITTYDKKLLQIEAMSSIKQLINREKKASYDKAKAEGKEALKEYKAQAIAEQKKITERYQEMRKNNVEGRKTTEMRHKLMNTVHTLDQLLVNPTKKKHIPIALQKPVAEALNILNTDTVGAEERLAKITAELKTTDDPVEIERLLERYNRIKAQGDKIKEKIDSLKAAYDKLLTSEDDIIRNSHDEVISNMIQNASEKICDKAVRDMTYDELEMLYKMYRAILKTVRDANTSFKMAKGEEISTLGQSVMGELAGFERKNKEQIKLIADIKDGAEWYQWNNLKPIYAFKRIGSSTLETLYNNIREGEDVWAVDMSEARAFSDAEKTKFGYSKWDMDKSYTFRTRSGKDFKLTLGQIMSIYAYTKRGEQAINHLVDGGFVYDGTTEIKKNVKSNVEITYELKDSTAYRLSEEIIGQINATLTPAQKSFVDSMQNYLSTVMGEKGNEVSLALYDIKLFGEKNYFPLKSSQVFLERAREQARGEVKVKNKGFTKETTPKANNPIVLESFMDVWANHCVEMGMYHAFTLPLEDFYRVYNYKERATDEKDSESVIMHLENAFGNSATKYIDQLLVDINGGTRADPRINFSSRWIAKFKKAKTFLSASVVIQQPSAVTRAMALIDGKYFIEKPTNHKATWNEIKKYAPVAIIKEMGYFDTGMGLSSKDWLKNEPTKMEKMEEALSKAPAYADEIGWNIIWRAVKREVAATTNLKVNSEEFLQRCGERFTEVITMTQVYDSVFARSSLMRSKDGLAKMLTAFMAEPTTTINMLTYGLNQRVRGNKGVMSHFVGACLTSAILNSMLVSIVYAARDDDEDEEYWERYLGAFGKQTIDSVNVFKMMPFIKDMVSIFEGFTVSRTDVSLITDIYWAWQKLDNDNVSAYKKVEDFAGSIAAIFGVPLKNLMRDLRALWNLITSSMK